ncbi:hypothetical protein D3C76_469760 [compost metagenome]
MPGGILEIDRIPQTIGIGIEAATLKGAPTVGAVKSHQSGVVGPIPPAEQVTPG